jgi:hypothetical protein
MIRWFLIEYTAGVVMLASLLLRAYVIGNRADNYHGRHRPNEPRPPLLHWLDNYRGRITHYIAVNFQPVMAEPELRLDDTQAMVLPDFDGDVDDYHHELAPGRMSNLREENLDASAARAQRVFLRRTELHPLRLRPAFQIEEITDDVYAEAMAS